MNYRELNFNEKNPRGTLCIGQTEILKIKGLLNCYSIEFVFKIT